MQLGTPLTDDLLSSLLTPLSSQTGRCTKASASTSFKTASKSSKRCLKNPIKDVGFGQLAGYLFQLWKKAQGREAARLHFQMENKHLEEGMF